MIDILLNIMAAGFGLAVLGIWVVASFAAAAETSERRKNYRMGTHDYYGNKLDE